MKPPEIHFILKLVHIAKYCRELSSEETQIKKTLDLSSSDTRTCYENVL